MPAEWERIQECFFHALELEGSERAQFLESKVAPHPEIHKEVLSLLASHDRANLFLEKPPTIARTAIPILFSELPPGKKVGEFTIERVLGAGSFATVYLARQEALGRRVALKISPDLGEEAKHMAPLEHDHIVRVFSQSREAGLKILCMQYVPGTNLEELLRNFSSRSGKSLSGAAILQGLDQAQTEPLVLEIGPLKDRERLETFDGVETSLWFGICLTEALGHAHKRGVLHLDVKPGNILINPYGRPLLTDFNVALSCEDADEVIGGTMDFMSPEQLAYFKKSENGSQGDSGPPIDLRADIYSLGVVLRLLLKSCSFSDKGKENPDLSISVDYFETIIEKSLSPSPEQRFSSAEEMGAALRNCLEHRQIMKRMPRPDSMRLWELRNPLLAITVLTILPQVLGSVVNISYNAVRIVSQLSSEQQSFFQFLCLVYNPIAYSLILVIALKRLGPLFGFIKKPRPALAFESDRFAEFRNMCLHFPVTMSLLISTGWAIGMVFFPGMIHLFHGPVDKSIFLHFAISFLLSWIVALTYSILFNQSFILRVLYPKFCVGMHEIRKKARQELPALAVRIERFHLLAGFVPLLSAVYLLIAGSSLLQDMHYHAFAFLVASLIIIGLVGFVTALRGTKELGRTWYAWTGRNSNSN